MNTSDTKATGFSSGEEDSPLYFNDWLRRRRQELDLTQEQLAKRTSCSVFAIRKIELGERRPSKQLAGLLAQALEIPAEDQDTFIKVARGGLSTERLASPARTFAHNPQPAGKTASLHGNLPKALTPFIGREPELSALGQLLCDPACLLVSIVGPGGIGKTRLAIEAANRYQERFPDGVWFVPLGALNSPALLAPAVADAINFQFQDPANPQAQLIHHLCEKRALLILDNAEHLLDGVGLFAEILKSCPHVKLLVTSRERLNLLSEWVFDVQGLPVPASEQDEEFESYSSVALFLQSARRVRAGFELGDEERRWVLKICQIMEGMPLGIELSAAWVGLLPCEGIAKEIERNIDFLTVSMRDLPERHQSLRAVFAQSWNLLSNEEKNVLCRLAVFRGGFRRQAAEQVAGASLPVLMSLISKSLLIRRENGLYDLHALIQQYALEQLQDAGHLDETCHQHLAYFVSLAREAQQGLRSAKLAEWLNRLGQEHNNIRAALEWAFSAGAPPEYVEEGLVLITSIDRYWAARGHILEGITWIERGLQASQTLSLARAKAFRIAGWLYNHGDDSQTAIALLQESVAISKQLNDVTCQADALDTLGDVGWRFGDFANARGYYADSLELYRKGGDPLSIGLSLASAGRLHVDYGYYQEAEELLTEGMSFLNRTSDLRGRGYCLNALGRLALMQGEVMTARTQFREALHLNYELGHMVDISECLHELAVVEAIAGQERRATLLWAAATALKKRIGLTYPVNDPVYLKAPATWLQKAPTSGDWSMGEMLSLDQAVSYALQGEMK